jgi:hypothetical protein
VCGLVISLFAVSCLGIQGGSEEDSSGICEYKNTALADPDAIPEGFSMSPRQAFAPAHARL